MFKTNSLLFHLVVFALALTIPSLVTVVIATHQFASSERARLEALAEAADQEITTLVNQEITTRVALLQALSTARSLESSDYGRFEQQLRELSRLKQRHFVLFDRSGQQLINTRVEYGHPLPQGADPDVLRGADGTRPFYVSNLFTGAITKRPTLQVAVPIRRNGDVVAILSSTFFPERLVELLKEGLPPGPFYATILDRNGVIVARSVLPEQYIGKPLKALADGSKGSKGSLDLVNPQGVPIFAHYRRPEMTGWVIAAAVERAALTAPLTRSLYTLGLVAVALALLALGVAGWIALKILRAKNALIEAAEAVGAGRVIASPRTPLTEADRIGDALAKASRSISEQALALQQTNQQLERRVLERTEELASKTALLETTLDTMTQGLIVIDACERIPVCNKQARMMLDLPDDLVDARPTIDDLLQFKSDHGEFERCSKQSFQLLRPKRGDELSLYERERPNGRILQVTTVPISDGAGFVRTYTDVTAMRWHERELEVAKRDAEAANEAKGDFLANISHEMRTPLNAIVGYSDLLLTNTSDAEGARRYAQRIHGASNALLSLVDDLLDLGKIEAGVIDVRCEPFRLGVLLNDVLAIVRPNAVEKGLQLDAFVDTTNDVFVGDRDRMRQILLNLFGNAIKFTAEGGISLCVEQTECPEGGSRLRFSIIDTGIGIAKADQDGLFQRFHQVDPSMQRRYGGAGLGLAISKQLVERLGGRVGLDSELGSGSTFWFELDLATARSAPPTDGAAKTLDTSKVGAGARILLAEDVILNQELARELLELEGYEVDVVANGLDAVIAAKNGGYDVVLMDLSMPEMDGLTATRRIREAGIGPDRTAIIACTANVLPAQVTAFRDAGVDAYLRKPLRSADLYATIERLVEPNASSRAGSERERSVQSEAPSLESLVRLLGPQRVLAGVEQLHEELQGIAFDAVLDDAGRHRLAKRAHALISTACLLELTELAHACRSVENACQEGADLMPVLARLEPVVGCALSKTDRLKNQLVEPAASSRASMQSGPAAVSYR